ncbi:hypothetical protein P153DRAFT_58607 [Dothidotthia symphoricarpi CBS 119687]|uniref:Uncharacterized protein n=1 Tax=Dothidotthia symphoricarpi CBS 119687 TaxID=1392245 RepID=A0A6A6A8G2_9PLEO|nr:uncharacterized protein P153DRAFT_58607 [Dothidotthia symphoricarpi CBS 119687]KAF2127098.1 hypothetical protein P153DRAFT_58607 [Dothidotthia symphoricarpi CBS 119687]
MGHDILNLRKSNSRSELPERRGPCNDEAATCCMTYKKSTVHRERLMCVNKECYCSIDTCKRTKKIIHALPGNRENISKRGSIRLTALTRSYAPFPFHRYPTSSLSAQWPGPHGRGVFHRSRSGSYIQLKMLTVGWCCHKPNQAKPSHETTPTTRGERPGGEDPTSQTIWYAKPDTKPPITISQKLLFYPPSVSSSHNVWFLFHDLHHFHTFRAAYQCSSQGPRKLHLHELHGSPDYRTRTFFHGGM